MSETALRRSKAQDSLLPRRDLMLRPSQTRTSPPTRSTPARRRSHTLYPETPRCQSHALCTAGPPCSDRAPQHLRSSRAHSRCRLRHRCDPNCPLCQTSPAPRSSAMTCMERRKHCPLPCPRSTEPCGPSRPRSTAEGCLATRQVPRTLPPPCAVLVHTHPRLMSTQALRHIRIQYRLLRLASVPPECIVARRQPHRLPQHGANLHWLCSQVTRRIRAWSCLFHRSPAMSTTFRMYTRVQNPLQPTGRPAQMRAFRGMSLLQGHDIVLGGSPGHTLRRTTV